MKGATALLAAGLSLACGDGLETEIAEAPGPAGQAVALGQVAPQEEGLSKIDGTICERTAALARECGLELPAGECEEPEGEAACYADCALWATCEQLTSDDPEAMLSIYPCIAACKSQFR